MKALTYIAAAMLVGSAFLPLAAAAQGPAVTGNQSPAVTGNQNPAVTGNSVFQLKDPLGIKNFCDLVRSLLNIVMAIGLPVAVFFFVWSGFRFILARGSQEKLNDAKRNFYYVIIGIAVFLGAWTLASIISATIQTLDTSGTIQFCGRS